ncbi:MAG: DedA family protein [Alistipes sp.]|nr:DedA family protein [Alistipes sp.]
MEAIIASLNAALADWGYAGLFVASLVAGSILPFASEAVLGALIAAGLDPVACVAVASVGNTAGGMTCWLMGRAGDAQRIARWLRIDESKIVRAQRLLQGRGALAGFFAFLPYIGEAIAVVLGMMRSNAALTALSMLAGKTLRYVAIAAAVAAATA